MNTVREIKPSSRISELSAGPLRFFADKGEDGIISFTLEYEEKLLVDALHQEAAKLFCGCVTDVFKRESIK